MLELYKTPLDILYGILTIGAGAIALFLVILLIHLIGTIRNINKITEKTRDTLDLVNHYLWQPIKIMMMVMEKGKEFASRTGRKR